MPESMWFGSSPRDPVKADVPASDEQGSPTRHRMECVTERQADEAVAVSGTLADGTHAGVRRPPGTERPRRFRPKLRYELIGCGLHGHELLGTDVAHVRPEDALVLRVDADGLRWYRCLRCDSWLPLLPPGHPEREHLPPRDEITLPMRGKALRDKYVLRVIAVDRFAHFAVLGLLAVAVLLFRRNEGVLNGYWVGLLRNLQAGVGGPVRDTSTGLVGELNKLFRVDQLHLLLLALALAAYAALEGVEAVGLWFMRRWAEYLTFVATAVLLLPELYELTHRLSALKVLTLLINLAVVVYLLFAKRLFGLRGGGRADEAERERDSGWEALERTLPPAGTRPTAPAPG
jgi:uncharacterized membrane protein (DUF2068 family)